MKFPGWKPRGFMGIQVAQPLIHYFNRKCHRGWGFPDGLVGKSACNAGDQGSIPGLRRPPGGGNGNPLQYSCLENSVDRGAWWAMQSTGLQSHTRLSE